MVLQDVYELLASRVFTIPSTRVVFNPYHDEDTELDLPGASAVRRQNAERWLGSYSERPRVLVIGKAPSGRGFRFSGIPFASERQLTEAWFPVRGCLPASQRSATGSPMTSPHDTRFWNVMRGYLAPEYPRFLAWNCVPLHLPGSGWRARGPSKQELSWFTRIAGSLVELLSPSEVIALGAVTEQALHEIGVSCRRVHSVSNDFQQQFRAGICAVFERLRR